MYRIKGTEKSESGKIHIQYMNSKGWWTSNPEEARLFETEEDAEFYIELEKCNPVYDKPFMGEYTFEVEGVK